MAEIKKALKFVLCLVPIAIAAGIFTGLYLLDTYSDDVIAEATAQLGSTGALVAVSTIQTVLYSAVCGFIGYILADKLGLWKPIKFEKKKLIVTLVISVVGGILFSLDYWTFGNVIDGVQSALASGMTLSGVIASVLYGGVMEEVMMRLFFMSLIAFIIWKLFFRKYDNRHIPTGVFVAANILAALAFAAGHLPSTISIFGQLTPLIVIRCFLLNGVFGMLFGWLYRKYGIVYSMTSHAVFHIVSKLIWLLFIF